MIRIVIGGVLAANLALTAVAAADGPVLPLAVPPLTTSPASGTIFDAMLAISRAQTDNPSAAQAASFPYAAAIQQLNAGDADRAQQSAIQAISKANTTGPLPKPNPPYPLAPSVSPGAPAQLPYLASVQQAEREERLALARRALLTCGPTTTPGFAAVSARYADAVTQLLAGRSDPLNVDVQTIVDYCSSALAATTATAEQ